LLTRKSPISSNKVPESGKGSFRFRREEHLKRREEIREVFGKGRQYSCYGAKLFVLKNDLPYNRICFTFSRSFGNAVSRNRARRLGREAFRLIKPDITGGHDLILLVYPESGMAVSDTPAKQVTLAKQVITCKAGDNCKAGDDCSAGESSIASQTWAA
jgi:ribonuclease P protein component